MKRFPLLPCLLVVCGAVQAASAPAPPPALADGWRIADPVAAGWRVEVLQAMERAIGDGAAPDTTSVLIARDGALVYEGYFNGSDADALQDTRSATKSVTAMLVGAAIAQGKIAGAQARVYDRFRDRRWRNPDPRKEATTVEDLLTMSSQLECDDENSFSTGNEERMYLSADWVQFALDLPVKGYAPWMKRPQESPHGRAFAYCTAGAFLLGALVEKATGQRLEDFAAQALERPLGIERSQWNHASEGTGMGGGGTRYRSRDLAKLGQLLLDRGHWQGKQVLPAAWVEAMTTIHAQARDDADYGYLLWRFRFPVRGVERGVWTMSGNGGNYVFVLPEERLVAVITRRAYNQRQMHQQSQKLFADYVLKALP